MPKIDVIDSAKKVIGSVELSDAVFAAKISEPIVHQVVVAQLAGSRSGTHSTKDRSEVRGGGRKPWKQKGLGRARAGTIRSPIWRGGGVIFGPKPRSYEMAVPKKMRKKALVSVLTNLLDEGRFVVLDSIEMDEIKTKTAARLIDGLGVKKPLLVVHGGGADKFVMSVRNIPDVKTLNVEGLNVYDLLNCENVVCTKDAVEAIEKRLSK